MSEFTQTHRDDTPSLGQLLEDAQQGNEDAFDDFAEQIDPAIQRVGWRVLRDSHLAEDARQETLLRIWQRIGMFDPKGSAGGWTTTIAYREAVGQHRHRSRFRRCATVARAGRTHDVCPPFCGNHESGADDAPLARVRELIAMLPDVLRLTIEMFYFENATLREIAERCGVPTGTVGSRLHRARRLLRDALSRPRAGQTQYC